MGRFTVYLLGCAEGLPVELDASSVYGLEKQVGSSRFIAGTLIDASNEEGVCQDRPALIPVSKIRLIVEVDR